MRIALPFAEMPRSPTSPPEHTATLLRLAADIARAGRGSEGWSEVFRQLGESLDCPEVFGDENRSDPKRLAVTVASCARQGTGRCGCGPQADESKRQKCLALLEHLELALGPTRSLQRHFEDMPRPFFLIDAAARLLDANAEGRRVLNAGRWLLRHGEAVALASDLAQRALLGMLKTMNRRNDRESACQRLVAQDGERAELWVRPVPRGSDAAGGFLLSLVIDADPVAPESLSPRQAELAGHLLAGRNLNEAATAMGITRRTAKDHLGVLFKLSHTRRQSDLVVWLTRRQLA